MEENLNNIILVPTDFSEVCNNAIIQATEAAKFFNYKLALLHVINKDTRSYMKKEDLAEEDINNKLEAIAADLRENKGIEVQSITREGSIFNEIANVAKEIGANLVYLGTHGKLGMQHLTGSFALKVVLSSPVPVIVVQNRKFENGFKEIVLPITSESGPWEKTKWAVFVAKTFNAKINILQANTSNEDVINAAKSLGEYLEKNGVAHSYDVAGKGSDFTKQVIDYSTAKNADLIMIMTNPEKGLSSFILGTYDEDIIFNTSQIPVMCINPRKFSYEIIGL